MNYMSTILFMYFGISMDYKLQLIYPALKSTWKKSCVVII